MSNIMDNLEKFYKDYIVPYAPSAIAGAIITPIVVAIAAPAIVPLSVMTVVGGAAVGVLFKKYGECNEENVLAIANGIVSVRTSGTAQIPRRTTPRTNYEVRHGYNPGNV